MDSPTWYVDYSVWRHQGSRKKRCRIWPKFRSSSRLGTGIHSCLLLSLNTGAHRTRITLWRGNHYTYDLHEGDTKKDSPRSYQAWLYEQLGMWDLSLCWHHGPWVVKVWLLLSLQQRGEGGWRGGCKDHFYKLQHSFIITNFSNHTKISSIKWAAAKQTGRCTFRWAELTHYTCRKLDITSKADPQNRFLSSGSISPTLIASSIWPSAMLAGWPRTGAAPGPRLSLITETRDGKTYKLLPPSSDHASAHNSASHANIMLYMLHHTTEYCTEFIWRLRCLYRALHMKTIAT